MTFPTGIDRVALCDVPVTLDGEPAMVCGYRNDFATVCQLRGPLRLEWAWETVARIISNGGDFRS
jgi:hypothetical protein